MKPRGTGLVYRRTYRDKKTRKLKYAKTWWVQYNYRGKMKRESSGSTLRSDALRLLKKRLAEMGQGQQPGVSAEKTTFEQMAEMLLNDYRANGRRSLNRAERSVKHLTQFFSMTLAADITTDRVLAYVAFRQDEGAANATINRELAALKRMFRLAQRSKKVHDLPYIPMMEEDNTRKGFFERDQFDAVLAQLPDDIKPVVEVAYMTGWRVDSEILTRQWQHVDLKGGWLRLEPGETKNKKGRMFPLTSELRDVFERQRKRTSVIENASGNIIPWVFHRNGKLVKSFRHAWATACTRAGVPGRLRHDFRRTAVRNLERAGVPRSDAMAMVGHLTESMYRRYAISDEASLRESAAKLSSFHKGEAEAERKHLPFRR